MVIPKGEVWCHTHLIEGLTLDGHLYQAGIKTIQSQEETQNENAYVMEKNEKKTTGCLT